MSARRQNRSWLTRGGVRWTLDDNGKRFAYVGDYTLRGGDGGGWTVTRDIDGDEVRVATGLTLDEATALARGNA